jgi:hypothetical protein
MAVTVFEVFSIIVLLIVLAYAIWFYVIQQNRKKFMDEYIYSRGANAWKDKSTVNLSCGEGREICVFRATQICSGNDDSGKNYEISSTDPISSGEDGSGVGYGDFNPGTTVDLTPNLTEACKGKNTCSYTLDSSITPFPFEPKDQCDPNNVQLLASYSCIPKGEQCYNVNSSS